MSDKLVVYPAVFELEKEPGYENYYNVHFPDVPSANTFGVGLKEATYNAWESLGLNLYDEDTLPEPTAFEEVLKEFPHTIVQYITVDLEEYKHGVSKVVQKVKKNTTIPKELAEEAEAMGINFSAVLTKGLYQEINEYKKTNH